MQFSPKLNEKISKGDALNDTELQVACDHFEALEALLCRTGQSWDIAHFAAIHEANRLRSFRDARRSNDRYHPMEHGVFDITYRDGAYRVSIPNYDGGKVVTLERHESALAEARLEGRICRAPKNAVELTNEVVKGIKAQIQARWKGGYPQEVVDDIVEQVLEPLLQKMSAQPAA